MDKKQNNLHRNGRDVFKQEDSAETLSSCLRLAGKGHCVWHAEDGSPRGRPDRGLIPEYRLEAGPPPALGLAAALFPLFPAGLGLLIPF